jgi:probable HAF family extracellular repeat protein
LKLRYSALIFGPVTILCGLITKPVCGAATFQSLGTLTGIGYCSALAVSGDGSIVVGVSSPPDQVEAFRWTAQTGMIGLGDLPGGPLYSWATNISSDGSVIVGRGRSSGSPEEAFRWTAGGGMVGLGGLADLVLSFASGVSADGNVVVGDSLPPTLFNHEAFYWTPAAGMKGLGYLPGGNSSAGYDVSADGSVVVGHSSSDTFAPFSEAFRWTEAGGMIGLGALPDDIGSVAAAVSADGSVVVGYSNINQAQYEAFRWTFHGGMIALGDLPGGDFNSRAIGLSADGLVVVGVGTSTNGNEAFYWTESLGMTNLRDLLILNGVSNLEGWQLTGAADVSDDGQIVVGSGINPSGQAEAWIVRIPEPSSFILGLLAILASFAILLSQGTPPQPIYLLTSTVTFCILTIGAQFGLARSRPGQPS